MWWKAMRRVRTSLFNVGDGRFFGGSLVSVDIHSLWAGTIVCGFHAVEAPPLSFDYGYACCD